MGRAPAPAAVCLAIAFASQAGACVDSLPHAARPTTSLRMHGTPTDAFVTIDEELVGPLSVVAVRGVALPQGTHQVTVEAPGYFPWDRLVKADGEKRLELQVDLRKVPE